MRGEIKDKAAIHEKANEPDPGHRRVCLRRREGELCKQRNAEEESAPAQRGMQARQWRGLSWDTATP